MEADFWHNRWEENNIGFHLPEANPNLVKFFPQLNLTKGSRIFVPLCGKTLDMIWLLAQGMKVVGVELSPLAVEQFFKEQKLTPVKTVQGPLVHYSCHELDIFVGNIFDLDQATLGQVDAIYDRAALVALPLELRSRYSSHLTKITSTAKQLLISFEYDQALISGPPFSVDAHFVRDHYQAHYHLSELSRTAIPGGLKGLYPAQEIVWLLSNKKG